MSAQELVDACKLNLFPSIATVTRFGLDGNNPHGVFACYRSAILDDGVTVDDLERNYEDLNTLILRDSASVSLLECYDSVVNGGGIRVSTECPQRECSNCRVCMVHDDLMCVNCGTQLKV